MEGQGRSKVTPLLEGELWVTKQMEGTAGVALPGHRASIESVVVVIEGQCIIRFADGDRILPQGTSFIVPPEVWHQVIADPDFKAIHIMPKEIRFDFSKA